MVPSSWRATRFNLAWKVAAGVPITDKGFTPSALVYWRIRLSASGSPDRNFDAVRSLVAEIVLARRTARVLDSTILDDAVVRQDTVMQLASQRRKVARLVPTRSAGS